MRVLLIFSLMLSGCATGSVCDYNWHANGWSPAGSAPVGVKAELSGQVSWFTNATGDYLVCSEAFGGLHLQSCGNVYEIHRKKAGGGYERDMIVCMK